MESKKSKAQASTLESLFFFKGLFSEAAPGGQAYLISVTFHVLISTLPLPVITVFYQHPCFMRSIKRSTFCQNRALEILQVKLDLHETLLRLIRAFLEGIMTMKYS